ncbi:conserved hypothetical protein [gamma proteobacterium HdN1]|nr:conserved hypothetical protein [gamma proteobacterium HdN1]
MNLVSDRWLCCVSFEGEKECISPIGLGGAQWRDIRSARPDFRGALYQFLIGLLQTAYAPEDLDEWRERFANPPDTEILSAAFATWQDAFHLESDGPAFMQDLALPQEVNQLPVLELLIDAGSASNLYFNKPIQNHGLCESCCAQALLTLQLNAPSGGRGVRTSLRGGGPLTSLLLPVGENATLWQKLWLNVLPQDVLDQPPIKTPSDVLPWLAATRTSDDKGGQETPPESVHPLQAYWSMPRRIRLDISTAHHGDCSLCGASDVRLFRHYYTRHGGTNYTGAWTHPLTPYCLDSNGKKPPISIKGRQAGRGYRDWLGLVLGNDDHQPDAAKVVAHFTAKLNKPAVRLWCFGYDMSNMKALCWYDSTLPVHAIPADIQRAFTKSVKQILDSANDMATVLHKQVKAAWFRRPGDVGAEPAVQQSFWQGSEVTFYRVLNELSALDFEREADLALVYRSWLLDTRRQVLELFDHWVLSGPVEDMDLQRVVKARADLAKDLNSGKSVKPLWKIVNQYHKEQA